MEKPVTITYDSETDTFTADENPVRVYPGVSTITWTIQTTNNSTGRIVFGTHEGFQGITFDRGWNGTPPRGDEKVWTTKVGDRLQPGDAPVEYHYTVKSLYQADDLTPAVRKVWDPDVEEEGGPPPIKK